MLVIFDENKINPKDIVDYKKSCLGLETEITIRVKIPFESADKRIKESKELLALMAKKAC